MLNWGWRRERGSLRTSAIVVTPWARTSPTKSSSACVEWPTVHTAPAYRSALDRAGRHALHEPLGEKQIEDQHGQGGDHQAGGEHADVLVLVAHEELDGQRQRANLLARDEDHRVEKLVPEVDEVQDDGGGHRRQRHREHHAPEHGPVAAAVDASGLLELGGDLGEERAQQVDRQRQLGGDVEEDQTGEGVEDTVLHEYLIEREYNDLWREH